MVSQVVKAEMLVGISFGITDYMGTYDIPEGLRDVVVAAERQAIFSEEGLAVPNPRMVAPAKVIDLRAHTRLLEIPRHLCSTSSVIAPGEVEFNHPEIGPLLNRYITGQYPGAASVSNYQSLPGSTWEVLSVDGSFFSRSTALAI